MNLFLLEDTKLKVAPETLLISAFKSVWDRDTSKSKERAFKELGFVYYMADYKSIYLSYPEAKREEQIILDIIKEDKWKPDEVIKTAIIKYEELQQTPSLRMLKGARKAQEAITKYYEEISQDSTKVNSKSVQAIAMSLEKMGKIAESIDKLEDKLKRESQTAGRSKGGRTINPFEE